jgi:ferrous iron transport protein A
LLLVVQEEKVFKQTSDGVTTNAAGFHSVSAHLPLTLMQVGKKVKIASITGGERVRARLANLGLLPDVEVQVLNRSKGGPLLLMVKGSRLALGQSLSSKIMVVHQGEWDAFIRSTDCRATGSN